MYTASWVQETIQAMKSGNVHKAEIIRKTAGRSFDVLIPAQLEGGST